MIRHASGALEQLHALPPRRRGTVRKEPTNSADLEEPQPDVVHTVSSTFSNIFRLHHSTITFPKHKVRKVPEGYTKRTVEEHRTPMLCLHGTAWTEQLVDGKNLTGLFGFVDGCCN